MAVMKQRTDLSNLGVAMMEELDELFVLISEKAPVNERISILLLVP